MVVSYVYYYLLAVVAVVVVCFYCRIAWHSCLDLLCVKDIHNSRCCCCLCHRQWNDLLHCDFISTRIFHRYYNPLYDMMVCLCLRPNQFVMFWFHCCRLCLRIYLHISYLTQKWIKLHNVLQFLGHYYYYCYYDYFLILNWIWSYLFWIWLSPK